LLLQEVLMSDHNEDDDQYDTLHSLLHKDDWAIIIGDNGNLKGLYIPKGSDEEEVPDSIVRIMEEYFGVDFDEEFNDDDELPPIPPNETLH
jgi:hypothetical protein